MKTLKYGQLNSEQQQQVNRLIADLESPNANTTSSVHFVARGDTGGEIAP